MRRLFTLILPLLMGAVALFASPRITLAATYGVQDDGHFFSADAVSQVDQVIGDIKNRHKKDVLVQTYMSIPQDMQDRFQSLGKQRFFEQWAEEIGRNRGVNGMVILACKDPSHLQIDIGSSTRQKAFTEVDREALLATMLGAFKQAKYDEGLLEGVKFIRSRMDQNLGAAGVASGNAQNSAPYYPPSRTTPSGGFPVFGYVCVGIGILLILFLIIGAFNRNRSSGGGYGGGPPPPGGYPPGYQSGYGPGGGYGGGYGGGGGGFGRGLLGGLLGGALGAWGYDRLSGRGESPGFPPAGGGASGGGFGSSADQPDTSFSGSGGDFGPSSSGGDFGGGADSGGGGGDFGSSGGDFGGGGGGDAGGGGGGGDF